MQYCVLWIVQMIGDSVSGHMNLASLVEDLCDI